MNVSVLISREALGLAPLQVEAPSAGYEVISIGPGARIMSLRHATSPVSDGAVLVGATAGLETGRLVVRVSGSTTSEILTRLDALEKALNQWAYTITVTIDTHAETWRCQPANYQRGLSGTYDAAALSGGWQELTAEIPRAPRRNAY